MRRQGEEDFVYTHEELKDMVMVDVQEMDSQHLEYVRLIGNITMCGEGGLRHMTLHDAVDELVLFTRFHFRSEENLMREYEYPSLDEHKQEHDTLVKDLEKMIQQVESPDFDLAGFNLFLINWFLVHTREEDCRLGTWVHEKRNGTVVATT